MSDPRSMDCELWARKKTKKLGASNRVQLVEIRPRKGCPVIGGIKLPPYDQMFFPNPPWHYHFAVLAGGLAHDELYPNGLPFEQYKLKFEFHDVLEFTLRKP